MLIASALRRTVDKGPGALDRLIVVLIMVSLEVHLGRSSKKLTRDNMVASYRHYLLACSRNDTCKSAQGTPGIVCGKTYTSTEEKGIGAVNVLVHAARHTGQCQRMAPYVAPIKLDLGSDKLDFGSGKFDSHIMEAVSRVNE